MYSFYGGKQGRTYNIVARYDELYINFNDYSSLATTAYSAGDQFKLNDKLYKVLEGFTSTSTTALPENILSSGKVIEIKGMVNKFQQGGSYTDVNYGQYVIIDTILNKNHYSDELNGLLYRRGFDYNEAATQATRPRKDDKDQHDNWIYYYHEDPQDPQSPLIFNTPLWTANWRKYVENPGGGAIYIGQIVGPQGDAPELHGIRWSDLASLSTSASIDLDPLLPGTELNKIQFGWATIKDSDGNVTGANIAFNIPYTVTQLIAPYDDNTYYASFEEDAASTANPFYYKWNVGIPQIKQFKIETYGDIYGGQSTAQYLTYSIDNAATASGQPGGTVKEHLGVFPWKVINKIIANAHSKTYYTWPSGVTTATANIGDIYPLTEYIGESYYSLTEDRTPVTGKTYYTYNYLQGYVVVENPDPSQINTYYQITTASYNNSSLTLICNTTGTVIGTDINLFQAPLRAGEIITSKEQYNQTPASWSIIDLNSSSEQQANELLVEYKDSTTEQPISFRQLEEIVMDATGNFYVLYSDTNKFKLIGGINWLNYIEVNQNNNLIFHYANGNDYSKYIKEIESIQFKNGIDQNQKFYATFIGVQDSELPNKRKTEAISEQTNTVLAIDRKGDNIIILYSNPDYRHSFLNEENNYTLGVDYYLITRGQMKIKKYIIPNLNNAEADVKEVPSSTEPSDNDTFVWVNFGSLGSNYHVFGDYSETKVLTEIPKGFADSFYYEGSYIDRAGWIISITDDSTGDILGLYAYDYNQPTPYDSSKYFNGLIGPSGSTTQVNTYWYQIMDLAEATIEPGKIVYLGTLDAIPSELHTGGLAFIVSNQNHSHSS